MVASNRNFKKYPNLKNQSKSNNAEEKASFKFKRHRCRKFGHKTTDCYVKNTQKGKNQNDFSLFSLTEKKISLALYIKITTRAVLGVSIAFVHHTPATILTVFAEYRNQVIKN